ncbi:tetratricopeptide repeat protein, partial [Myxococcota bacterium]|nr:tetratricopeptide repeat protein [Myxococcota bacterium]
MRRPAARAALLSALSVNAAYAQDAPPDALAAELRAAGLCDEAFLEYARLAATTPERPDSALKAGEALWCAGRYDDAARYFGQARAEAPGRGSLALGEAESLYLAGQLHDAALTLAAAPSPDPLGLDLLRGAWITLRIDGDPSAAADGLAAVPPGPLRPEADALAAALRAAPPVPHR